MNRRCLSFLATKGAAFHSEESGTDHNSELRIGNMRGVAAADSRSELFSQVPEPIPIGK
jgi:hypothetical protein